jgi:hypothetical protein
MRKQPLASSYGEAVLILLPHILPWIVLLGFLAFFLFAPYMVVRG